MRFVVAALVALFVFAPVAQARVPDLIDVRFDTVGPPAPAIVSPPEGTLINRTTVTITGTTVASSTVAVFEGATKLGDATVAGETWTLDPTGLAEGPHTLTAVATDAPGPSTASAGRHITVDPQAPAAVEPVQTGTSEFTFAGEVGATFECSVDGAAFTPCTSPQQLSGLSVGEPGFGVGAAAAGGNRSPPTPRTFSTPPPPAAIAPPPTAVVPPPAAPVVVPPA